jgi:uncharacterized protein (TIGR00299 family) protein
VKIAYFDCISGAAGDMIIGALLDAGLQFHDLEAEIVKLGLSGYELSHQKVTKNHISATNFSVEVTEDQPPRKPDDIARIITDSKLDDDVKLKSIAIFNRLAKAEAKVHGQPIEDVHFHEVGAVDAIIDICGAVVALKLLGIEKIYSSLLPLGTGTVETEHGIMPVPAPATAELVKEIPVKITAMETEMTTPTGAAILTTLAEFTDPGIVKFENTGYGAGSRDLLGLPNVIRVMIADTEFEFDHDTIKILETNLDRATPEMSGALLDELMSAGALDVFITPVSMKKNRSGHLLTVLCQPDKMNKLARIIFGLGMTLGIRVETRSRIKLDRKQVKVSIPSGEIGVKIATLDGRHIILPEFDDMMAVMKKSNRSYEDIYSEIKEALRKES